MGLMDLFGRKNTSAAPVRRQRPASGAGLSETQLRAELVALRREQNADFVMYVESTFEIPGRGIALHGWLTGNIYLFASTGMLCDWQSLKPVVQNLGPVGLEYGRSLVGRVEADGELLNINVLMPPLANAERLHGMLYIGNGKSTKETPVLQPKPAAPAPRPVEPAAPAPQRPPVNQPASTQKELSQEALLRVKDELQNVIRKKDLLFAMQVQSAVNGRMGTVLSGLLLGRARKGGNVGYVAESGTWRELSGDMEILGLKKDGQLVEQLESGTELVNCAILVPAMTDPGMVTGNILCGGYRTEQPSYAKPLMEDLEAVMHRLNSGFAFSIQQAHDLGAEGTGLVGYLLGRVEALKDYGSLYDKEHDEFVSGPMQVTKLHVRRVEESSLRCMNSLMGCGIVVKGNLPEEAIAGRLVVLVGCSPEDFDNW